MERRLDDLLAEFLTETSESLSELDLAVVRLERAPDDQSTLSLIFRLVHTIKGTCGFLGLPRLERVAHASETVLDRLRHGGLVVSGAGIGLILSAIDRIRLIVDTISRTGIEPDGNDNELIAELIALAEGRTPVPVPAASVPAPISIPLPTQTLALDPASQLLDPVSPQPINVPAATEHPTDPGASRGQTIRVSVDVLETLMTLVSELVLTRNQFLQQLRSSGSSELTGPVQRLSHLTTELQEGVMKTRMQPIGNVWNMLPRQVRDLAHDLGKRVDLVMHGAETELDRQVLELIKDPLTHMIRNSADHGLEGPEERQRAGKPPVGTITLSARHEGGHVVIGIEDDGRGIDVRRISQGLSTRAQIDTMSDDEIRRFIFQPGFSTAAAVTSVSGRGVGMDVVKTNIEQIGGLIELHSVFGHGSRFLIKIPLTLAIVSALIVGVSGERFAIPQASVIEVVLPGTQSDTRMETIDGAAVLRLRDRLLPLIRLSTLLQLPDKPPGGAAGTRSDMVAVIGIGSARLGLIVDGVFDTEEIVVKPVASVLRHIPLFGGNTILEDGAVIMILDPTGIARHAGLDAARKDAAHVVAEEDSGTDQQLDMLLVRAGIGAPKALPLSLISRLETFTTDRLEVSGGRVVVQYRNDLMPVVSLDETVDMPHLALHDDRKAVHPILVFDNGGKPVGLMVEEILDVVNTALHVEFGTDRQGVLGAAIIAGQATDIIDAAFWLTRAAGNWFRANTAAATRKPRLLVIDDSSFFRQLVAPSLSAAGYDVTVAESAEKALAMREAGRSFDAVVSDIEMPGLGGLGFARKVREGGPWVDMPLLALTGSDTVQEARSAGFTDTMQKFERDTLLLSLEQCLSQPLAA